MIYDLLKAYRVYLVEKMQPATAETYYKKLCLLFEGQSISDTVGKLDIDKILEKLGKIKYKSNFSQAKNAFLHFCEFQNIRLSAQTLEHIRELATGARKKYRKLKPILYSEIDKKIKRIRDKRLKLSYQTMIATGLRVAELSDIAPDNCQVTNDGIAFIFTARGGTKAVITVSATEHLKLYQDLQALIENTLESNSKKLFYSANFLQRKAKALGFACHDLRRAFAKLEHKKYRNKDHVMDKLRHKSIKATNIYLRSKVKI